jgi:hypothetical protein
MYESSHQAAVITSPASVYTAKFGRSAQMGLFGQTAYSGINNATA